MVLAVFDPIEALVEDAVGSDVDMFHDYIDTIIFAPADQNGTPTHPTHTHTSSSPIHTHASDPNCPVQPQRSTHKASVEYHLQPKLGCYFPSHFTRHASHTPTLVFPTFSAENRQRNNQKRSPIHTPVGSPVSTISRLCDKAASVHDSLKLMTTAQAGQPTRKNKPQRCSICKEWGHKSRTCKLGVNMRASLGSGDYTGGYIRSKMSRQGGAHQIITASSVSDAMA